MHGRRMQMSEPLLGCEDSPTAAWPMQWTAASRAASCSRS